jgi:hypothetical protein
LADAAFALALQNLHDPTTRELTVDAWRTNARRFDNFPGHEEPSSQKLLESDGAIRRGFIKAVLNSPETTFDDVHYFMGEALLKAADLEWLLLDIDMAPVDRQPVWAELIALLVTNPANAAPCWDLLLDRKGHVPELGERLQYLTAWDVDHPDSRRSKARWLKDVRRRQRYARRRAVPNPEKLIAEDIEQFHAGNSDRWIALCDHLTLKEGEEYSHDMSHDLSQSPGWERSNEERRVAIRSAARRFLLEHDDGYDSLGQRTDFSDPGYLAVYLLRDEVLRDADLRLAVATKWVDAIVGRLNNAEEHHMEMVALAFGLNPDHCTESLLRRIREDDKNHAHVFAVRAFEKCWNSDLLKRVVELMTSDELKPPSVESILIFLAEVNAQEAAAFVRSMLHNAYAKVAVMRSWEVARADSIPAIRWG